MTVVFGKQRLTIEDITAIALNHAETALNSDAKYKQCIDAGPKFLDKLLEDDGVIYGVTTGYGDSCTVAVPLNLVEQLPHHLVKYHGCGMGKFFDEANARAIVAARLCSLAQGYSGVRWQLLQQLALLLNQGIIPLIPEEGSVGASGDLTPLSYVAAVLIGERKVIYDGEVQETKEVFKKLGIEPLRLKPKEGLAIMNGTAAMTGIACLAYKRAEYLSKLSARITSFVSWATKGNSHHFDERLFSVKPHSGQQQVASWIRLDLNQHDHSRNSHRLQDRYSIRCAPHVIGCIMDGLPWFRTLIENELNSANDNPIIDSEHEQVLHGGHFYGGHIAMAMDTMKVGIANLADLMDRQMALLMDPKFNHGLPANLSASEGLESSINHGFKAVQIAISAWTAEALKHTMPASVFSRSTECHNQDKVSMGTIAARDCMRILELTEQVCSASLLACTQAVYIATEQQGMHLDQNNQAMLDMYQDILSFFKPMASDRPLDDDLRKTMHFIQQQRWELF